FELRLAYLNRALAIHEKVSGSESTAVAEALATLGALESSRNPEKALVHLKRALAIQEKAFAADSPLIGLTLLDIGSAYLNLHQPQDAKPSLERAARLLESSKQDPVFLARARFRLAQALWETHSDRERAITLAQEARATLLKASKAESERLREIE